MDTIITGKFNANGKSFFAFLGIILFVFLFIELLSYAAIRLHYNVDPLAKSQAIYNKEISGYYVSRTSPNFKLNTLDGLHNFKPTNTFTDINGFICDKEISRIKESNVVRIFLIGGSVAFGSIQNHNQTRDRTYPSGTYDYPSSICGLLKVKLQKQFPDRAFEVINAATPGHSFHQGYFEYLALLHDFSPDIIINMDGTNDDGSILTGLPFLCAENADLENLVALKNQRPDAWPFSLFLYKYYRDRNYQASPLKITLENVPFTERDYDTIASILISKSHVLIWLIASYENQLKQDGVHSLFVLQPLLRRIPAQKKLSPLEKKLLNDVQITQLLDIHDPADIKAIHESGADIYLKLLGNKMDALNNIMTAYYFDRYFTDHVDSIVRNYGNDYIDMNKEMMGLSDNAEIFVDRCHLTPYGNEFVAQKLSEHLALYLNSRAIN